MVKARKGFTLVELLIVVAVVATLSATLTMSMRGTTAGAKASAIAANLDMCRAAANVYYSLSKDNGAISADTGDQVLSRQIKTWDTFKGTLNDAIRYGASGTGPDNWVASVDFTADAESKDVATALQKIRGYHSIPTTRNKLGKVKMYLLTASVDVYE